MIGTLSREDANELIAGLDLRTEALAGRIDEGKAYLDAIKQSLDPKVAKLTMLIPSAKRAEGELSYITKGKYQKIWGKEPKAVILTPDGKRVRWEYALDEIAQELHLEPIAQAEGKAPDEYLKGLIEEAKETKRTISATEHEVISDVATLKALGKLKASIEARAGETTTESLLHKLAKPKLRGKPTPIRKAHKMLADEAQRLIRKTQAARTSQAVAMDNALLAKRIVPPSQAPVWAKMPNRLDIRGVDTPQRKHSQPAKRKAPRRGFSKTVSVGR
jgi:hypothetical protein